MAGRFDPYDQWLGISPNEQPADHYRLLGVSRYESDACLIDAAADRQAALVRGHVAGSRAPTAQQLLKQIAAARICLLTPGRKTQYDAQLRQQASRSDNSSKRFFSFTKPAAVLSGVLLLIATLAALALLRSRAELANRKAAPENVFDVDWNTADTSHHRNPRLKRSKRVGRLRVDTSYVAPNESQSAESKGVRRSTAMASIEPVGPVITEPRMPVNEAAPSAAETNPGLTNPSPAALIASTSKWIEDLLPETTVVSVVETPVAGAAEQEFLLSEASEEEPVEIGFPELAATALPVAPLATPELGREGVDLWVLQGPDVVRDTLVRPDAPHRNYGHQARQNRLERTHRTNAFLVRFELSGAQAPAAGQLISATLSFYVWDPSSHGRTTVCALPLKQAWDEDTATWRRSAAGAAWLGGDCYAYGVGPGPASPQIVVLPNRQQDVVDPPVEYQMDVTGMVRTWLAGQPNHGLAIAPLIDPSVDRHVPSYFSIYGSEHERGEFTPKLTVRYAEP